MDLSLLRQLSAERLMSVLKRVDGAKELVMSSAMTRSLDMVAGMSALKSAGVQTVRKFTPVPGGVPTGVTRVFLVSGLEDTRAAADIMRTVDKGKATVVIFVPRVSISCTHLLESEGLIDRVRILSYAWQMIPIDTDLLTLAMPDFFKECYATGDWARVAAVSEAVVGFEALFGAVTNRVAVGRRAAAVLTQIEALETAAKGATATQSSSQVGHMLLIDREVDFASCLLSPVSYEALLDDVFGITCGNITMEDPATKQNAKISLSKQDKLFDMIRFKPFSSIFSFLSSHARQLKQAQSRASTMSVTEMREFVEKNLRDMQRQSRSVAVHIGASESIQTQRGYIFEELLHMEFEVVRGGKYREAIALLEEFISYCQGGIVNTDYERVVRKICDNYGFKQLVTVTGLNGLGLLNIKNGLAASEFVQASERLGLLPRADDPSVTGKDADGGAFNEAYVFNGSFVPVVCKIMGDLVRTGKLDRSVEQTLPSVVLRSTATSASIASAASQTKSHLVVFIGGFSYAEVAALRALQAKTGHTFYIAGTDSVSGNSIVSSVMI